VLCAALAKTAYRSTDLQDEGLLLADIYTVQCAIHNETSKVAMAVSYARKAYEIRERAVVAKVLEEDHPNRANGFMNLGVCIANDDIQEALRLHDIAIKIREGSSRYSEAQVQGLSLNYLNIGRCWWMVGELEKAAKSFEKSLSIIKMREATTGLKFAQ
jgi:tetratricopeptide (TPR) repeat protein